MITKMQQKDHTKTTAKNKNIKHFNMMNDYKMITQEMIAKKKIKK